eukprot:COSAG01_NODE_71115_length_257_cov_0.329114_1_plen_44_part_10
MWGGVVWGMVGVGGNACYMVVVTTTSSQSSIPFAYCTDMTDAVA